MGGLNCCRFVEGGIGMTKGLEKPSAEAIAQARQLAADVLKRADLRIRRARTQMILKRELVFWSTGALHLQPVPVFGLGTMGVDGKHLYYDPLVVASNQWNDEEMIFVIAHEAGHCMSLDHARREEREPRKWNVACDMRLNPALVAAGLKQPAGALGKPEHLGISAERLYLTLTDDDVAKAFGGGMGGAGLVYDAEGDGEANGEAAKRAAEASAAEWDLIARQAAYLAKQQGKLPAGFEHLLEPKRPALDPRSVLRQFMSMSSANDYSWSRPNRRFIYRDLFLPSLRSESMGPVVIFIDTSGSISDGEASRFLGFVNAVLVDVKPETTWLVQCDAWVQSATAYPAGAQLPATVTIKGRGGTDMRPVWEWERREGVRPVCTIGLSDMCMSEEDFGPEGGPGHPVLWISSTPDGRAPWGTVVYLGED